MNGDVKADEESQKPTDEELADLMFYDEIIATEREAAELEAAEHEIRAATLSRSHSVD